MIDANEGITEQDTKVAGYAHEQGKACIFAVNKWDIVSKDTKTMKNFTMRVREEFAFMSYAEIIFISAKTGQRVDKLLELIKKVNEQHKRRITTGMLNDVLNEAMAMQQPPSDKGQTFKGLLRYTGCNSTADIYFIRKFKGFVPLFIFEIYRKSSA